MTMLSSRVTEYVRKALSLANRKPYDGDSNATYRVMIEFAEVGELGREEEGFWFQVTIPRQIDNELGMSIRETVEDRKQAARVLRMLADELEKEPC